MLLALLRLVRGPRLPDRVVALELTTTLTVAIAAVHTVGSGHPAFLDAALVLALVSFLGTVAVARYIEERVAP
ncbi:MAG: monovalent cation/H+ antiporter complex subunit F [Halobacteria archaeon]